MLLQSFDLNAAEIGQADLDQLLALSIGVRWPHRPDDWRMLLGFGRGVVALDEIGRAAGTAMWFPYAEDFATIGMVITAPRFQANGAGGWLMDKILAAVGSRALGLNATAPAYRLYRSLGFRPEATVFQCQGEAILPPEEPDLGGGTLRELTQADLASVLALDGQGFGVTRDWVIRRVLAGGRGIGLFRDGALAAFAVSRPFGRGHVVGPIVASGDADAIAVTRPHVGFLAGRFLRIDTRQEQGAFPTFVQRCGLGIFDTVTTMSLRRPWPKRVPGEPAIYGLVSQAFS